MKTGNYMNSHANTIIVIVIHLNRPEEAENLEKISSFIQQGLCKNECIFSQGETQKITKNSLKSRDITQKHSHIIIWQSLSIVKAYTDQYRQNDKVRQKSDKNRTSKH